MPLDIKGNIAILSGRADITESEPLLEWLTTTDDPVVDVSDCQQAHTAVLQVLRRARPTLVGHEHAEDWRALLSGAYCPAPTLDILEVDHE